jgi:hypothetical protein
VLATSAERCAHWFCVFCPHSCRPIIPRALSRTPTYPTVLTIVHSDGTSILSLHNKHKEFRPSNNFLIATILCAKKPVHACVLYVGKAVAARQGVCTIVSSQPIYGLVGMFHKVALCAFRILIYLIRGFPRF